MQRRRKQIRVAQRAYREREKKALSQNQTRIAQLEISVRKMNKCISSFGEHLTKSGVLMPHADLQDRLFNTISMCKSLVREASLTTQEESSVSPTQNDESHDLSIQPRRRDSDKNSIFQLGGELGDAFFIPSLVTTSFLHKSPEPLGHGSPLLFGTAGASAVSVVDVPTFISQLRLACAYNAIFLLRNSSVKLDELRKKFRFLMSILTRENLISYFEARLIAKIHPESMLEWEELPFFQVGGAGTHFLQPSYIRYNDRYPIQNDPLAAFSPVVQDEMDGKWYDASDLEGLLQERGVRFLTTPPKESQRNESDWITVDPSKMIKGKLSCSVVFGTS